MTENSEELFINSKPSRILVKLSRRSDYYASQLSTEVDATYSHTVKILQRMKKHSLVEFEKKGRKKIVKLTDKGQGLAEIFRELISEFETETKNTLQQTEY